MKRLMRVCLVVGIALAVGGVAGWFAERAWGKAKCENVEMFAHRSLGEGVCKYGNMKTANDGRDGYPLSADTAAKGEVSALRRHIREVEGEIASIEEQILGSKTPDKSASFTDLSAYSLSGKKIPDGVHTFGELKAAVPEEYKKRVKLCREFIDKVSAQRPKYESYVERFDLSRLSEEDAIAHGRYVEMTAKACAISKRQRPWDNDYTPGEYLSDWGDYVNAVDASTDYAKPEASILIGLGVEKRAKEMGFSDEDAAVIANAYRGLFEATNITF